MSPQAVVGILIFALWVSNCIKVLREYERGVIFRLGKVLPKPKGPGLILVLWPIDKMVKVDLRIITLDVPPQDIITRDNVTVKVNAVVFYRVMDAQSAIIQVERYIYATSQAAETIARQPVAIQLRYLQTLTEIGTEKNTTIVFPLPVEMFGHLFGIDKKAPAEK